MRALARLLGIQPGEGSPVAWLIALSLFNGIFSAFFLTAANALFLARFPITVLPLAYIAAAGVGYVAVTLQSWLDRRTSFPVFLLVNVGSLLAITSAFWFLRQSIDSDWIIFSMFVFVGPMFNVIALAYWRLAGRLFDLRQAKRLFGLVGAGEEMSTIVSLFATPLIVTIIGTPNLVLLAATGLAGSFITALLITHRFRASLGAAAGTDTAEAKAVVGLGDLLRARYFLLMAACVVLLNLALYIIDFGFLAQVRLQFQGPGQIAQFFAIFYGALKIVELLLKVGVSGPLLSHFGLNVGLLVLPILLAASAALAIATGTFGLGNANFFVLVALSKLVAVTGRSSLFEPSFRVLYQPVSATERSAYQSHVDGTARQFSIGVVGIALLLFSRGGAFNALHLFYVLVPILGLWIVAAVLVHREYRVRLFEGLKRHTGGTERRAPLDVLMPYLRSTEVHRRRRALSVIERIEPGSLPTALTSALDDGGRPAVRVAGLECVGTSRLLDFEPQVARLRATRGTEPAFTTAVEWASSQLAEVRALQADPARIDCLAGSADVDDRHLAAVALGYGQPKNADRLTTLLWDRDTRVRRAALASAGRLGNPEFRPVLARHLGIPMFASSAAAALVAAGPAVVPDLESAFSRTDQTPVVRRKILKILHDLGDLEALATLASKLDSPERTVRRRAIELLVDAGYRATAAQVALVERVAENLIRDLAWDMNVLVTLETAPDVDDVREALENELTEGRRWLFDLLSLVYDAGSITAVREIVERGSPQAMVHALEILDLMIAPALKPFLFPLLEGQSYQAVVRKLEPIVPRQPFNPTEALRALVSRDFGRIGLWTRAAALDRLGRGADSVPADLVAFLFHPEPMIREIAAIRIAALDRRAWETHRKRLRFEIREALEAVLSTAGTQPESGAASIFGRTKLLRRVLVLAVLPPEDLIVLAAASEVRTILAGQKLPFPRDPQHTFFVTADREVVLTEPDGTAVRIAPLTMFTFEPGATALDAAADTVIVRIDPAQVFELASEEPELIPGLVQAAEALGRDAAA